MNANNVAVCWFATFMVSLSYSKNTNSRNVSRYMLEFSTEVVSYLEPGFGGVTLDWWNPGTDHFGSSGVRLLNLSDTALNQYARHLNENDNQPITKQTSTLRIGGTMQDSLIYNVSSMVDSCENYTFIPANSTSALSNYTAPHPDYVCHKWLNGSEYGCISSSLWNQIIQFTQNNHFRLVFGLNACNGRYHYDSLMDFTNMISFLNQSQNNNNNNHGLYYGLQFGNEKMGPHISIDAYAQDTVTLRDQIIPDHQQSLEKPLLLVPEADHWDNHTLFEKYFAQLSSLWNTTDLGHLIGAISYHIYPKCQSFSNGWSNDSNSWDIDCLSQYKHSVMDMVKLAQKYHITRVILSETGEQSGGGLDNETNVFLSCFWFTYALGSTAHSHPPIQDSSDDGFDHIIPIQRDLYRQTLIGGYYGLLSPKSGGPSPNPDYWILYVWKKVVGRRGWKSFVSMKDSDASDGLRAWVFQCSDDSHSCAMLVCVNFDRVSSSEIELRTERGIQEWKGLFFQSPSLISDRVYLNGKLMKVSKDWEFPILHWTEPSKENTIDIPPSSIAFINLTLNTH